MSSKGQPKREENIFPECMRNIVEYHRKEKCAAWDILKDLGDHIKQIDNERESLREQLNRTHDALQRTKKELDQTRMEKENALLRLSKEAGLKLHHQNPNIADLSDPDRPLKLGERFSEIYDNEWTDAYEQLEGSDEIGKVQELLNTAQLCYDTCQEKELQQWNSFVKGVGLRPTTNEEEKNRLSLSPELTKVLVQQRKETASTVIHTLKQEYQDVAGSVTIKKKEFRKFIDACLECFWLAVIHDPPLFFDFESKPGSKYNADENRVFTKSGDFIRYVVWPAVHLHDSGPLLSKGVVQCTSDTKKLKFVKDENVHMHHGKVHVSSANHH